MANVCRSSLIIMITPKNEIILFIFWRNHNNEARATNVSHKELFEWFKIDKTEFDKKFMESPD